MEKIKLLTIVVLIIITFVNVIAYTHLEFVFNGDAAIQLFNSFGLWNSIFSWDSLTYSGAPSVIPSITVVIYETLMLPLNLINSALPFNSNLFLQMLVGSIGMFLLVSEFTKNFGIKVSAFSGATAAIIFTIQINFLSGASIMPVMMMPLSFLFLFLFLSKNDSKEENFWFCLSVLSFAFLLGFSGATYLIQDALVISITFLILMFFTKHNLKLHYAKYFFALVLLILIININMLTSSYFLSQSVLNGGNFVSSSVTILKHYSISALDSILAFLPSQFSVLLLFPAIGIFLISISSLYVLYRKQDRLDLRNQFILIFIINYLMFVALADYINKPFGPIFLFLLKNIQYLIVFRLPYTAIHPILLFMVSALFGFGVAQALDKLKNYKYIIFILICIVIIILIVLAYVSAVLPITTAPRISIPNHVYKISDYINNNASDISVGVLPIASPWEITNWYWSTDIYSAFIRAPVYSGGYSGYSNTYYLPQSILYYYNTGSKIDNTYMNNVSISNLFGIFGIKYIIIQGDATHIDPVAGIVPASFNFSTIYYNLNKSKNIVFLTKHGNSSIYINNRVAPLVYPTGIIDIGNASINDISGRILNKTFNIFKYSLYSNYTNANTFLLRYSTSISDGYIPKNKIVPNPIKKMHYPVISFIRTTPTKVTVHVSNATTPYYLVFRETYDPGWAAFYSNSTEVNQSDHIAVNGFANAWYMNRTGNYTITLYYTPQTIAWIAWAVSFVALGATVAIGVYGWKERKTINTNR